MFDVIFEKEVSKNEVLEWVGNRSIHIYHRQKRFSVLNFQQMEIYKAFVVDTNHVDGLEIHVITRNAEALIFNCKTKKFITILFLRPRQAKRYGWMSKEILKNAKRNIEKGLYVL